jgi:hypothetical protein
MDAHTVSSMRAHPRALTAAQPSRRQRRRILRHIFRRREVTTFQRCLAVHIYYAARVGSL